VPEYYFVGTLIFPAATPSITSTRGFLYDYTNIIRQLDNYENFGNNFSTFMR